MAWRTYPATAVGFPVDWCRRDPVTSWHISCLRPNYS